MKAYTFIYASAPDENSLELIGSEDVQPVIDLIARLAHWHSQEETELKDGSTTEEDNERPTRRKSGRLISDDVPPTPPLRRKKKRKG